MRSLVKKEQLAIRSNGRYVRDYVYVNDVVEAMILLMRHVPKVKGEAFNISSFENISVLELVKKSEQILGMRIAFKILATAKNEIPIQSINFEKIRKIFGWKPKNSLKSTLGGIYDWYKSYFDLS